MLTMNLCSHKIYRNLGNSPLLNLLPKNPGTCLDCGCGAGDNARILKSQGWKVTGITASSLEKQLASEFCEQVCIADLEDGIPKTMEDIFDIVLMSHVLEHLVKPENLLQDAKRLLSEDGMIAVAIPNVLCYPNRLRFLLGKFDYSEGGSMDKTHLRFYTFKTAAALLQANGYKIVTVCSDGAVPLWKFRDTLPPWIVEKLTQWALQWRPGLFGFQTLLLAKVAI
ncbi:MAG: class I SAM-dependent methyltransferase [Dehalococcoidia bacterium]